MLPCGSLAHAGVAHHSDRDTQPTARSRRPLAIARQTPITTPVFGVTPPRRSNDRCGAREHGLGEVAGEGLGGRESAFRRAQHRDRARGESPIRQEPLMGGGIGGRDERLMALLQRGRGAGSGALRVRHASLDVNVRCHPVQIACTRGTDDGLMPAL